MAVIAAGEVTKELVSLLHARRPEDASSDTPSSAAASSAAAVDNSGDGIDNWLETPLEVLLRRRGAVREFSAGPLPAGQVEDLVARGFAAERQVWRTHGDPGFAVLVAARRVRGLAEGFYAASPSWGDLVPVRVPAPLAPVRAAYADAPALLLICADPQRQVTHTSGSSYGSLLVRAGTLGYAIWLSATSAGLAGCVYGGACHDVTLVARYLNPRYRHLFTVAVGAPAGTVGAPAGN